MHLLVERKNRKTVRKEHRNSTRLQFSRSDLSETQYALWNATKGTKETEILMWDGFDLNLRSENNLRLHLLCLPVVFNIS